MHACLMSPSVLITNITVPAIAYSRNPKLTFVRRRANTIYFLTFCYIHLRNLASVSLLGR